MRISLRCLRTFISLEAETASIAHRLSVSGLEVEAVAPQGSFVREGFVLGTIKALEACSENPSLQLVRVGVGRQQNVAVVCGAAHIRVGQRVVLAVAGTMLPSGQEVKRLRMAGHMSEGVLCSARELGIGQDHSGLFEPETTALQDGTDARDYFSTQQDTVLEIGLTPNRGDAASHYGVARELHALYGWPLRAWVVSSVPAQDSPYRPVVEVLDTAACPRYAGIVLSDVQVGRSPAWLLARLEALSIGAVNNVVDITNYAMHMLGQPFHAFDWDTIAEGRIVVRRAGQTRTMRTLDGVARQLQADDLLICDAHKPLALAGLMGGIDTAIGKDTRHIFLESAYFSPSCIRATASRLGMQTEASFRYVRGIDPARTQEALLWVVELFSEVLGLRPSAAVVDVYPSPIAPYRIPFSLEALYALSGVHIAAEEVVAILKGLAIAVTQEAGDKYVAVVPPYRQDVRREADLFEEILRIYGYDKLPAAEVCGGRLARGGSDRAAAIAQEVSGVLAAAGFYETITSPLTAVHLQALVSSEADRIAVERPASQLQAVMRQSMIPSALEVVAYNLNHRQQGLCFFEHGKVYRQARDGAYTERSCLAMYVCGSKDGHIWQAQSSAFRFVDMTGVLMRIFGHFGLSLPGAVVWEHACFAQGLYWGAQDYVYGGELSRAVVSAMGIRPAVYYVEIDWAQFVARVVARSRVHYRAVAPFPEVRRDLSLVLDRAVSYARIEQVMAGFEARCGVVIKKMYLSSVYSGKGLGEGKKSYALSFVLSAEETLQDAQIHTVMDALIGMFEHELGAVIRKQGAIDG